MISENLWAASSLALVCITAAVNPAMAAQQRSPTVQKDEPAPVVLVVAAKNANFDVNAVLRAAIRAFVEQGLDRAKKNAEMSLSKDSQAWREYAAWLALAETRSDKELIPSGILQVMVLAFAENDGVVVALFARETSNVSFSCIIDRKTNIVLRAEPAGAFWSGFLRPSSDDAPRGPREWHPR